MLKHQKKGIYKALSMLMVIVMTLATPIATIQIYALDNGQVTITDSGVHPENLDSPTVVSPSAISILEADTTPPAFADDSPKQYGEPLHPGCKHVKMTVATRDEEEVTAYYVAVEHNAASPTSSQIKEGKNSENIKALNYGYQANVKMNGYIIPSGKLPADDTIYDFWFVLEDAAGNLSEPKCVELRTPIKILTDGYPKVGAGQAGGSKQVEILAKANGSATAYYVAVAAGDIAPNYGQVMRGEDSTNSSALVAGNVELEADTQDSIIVTLGEDFTSYDVYMVLYKNYHGGGFITSIYSEVVKLEVKTPDVPTSRLWEVANASDLEDALTNFQDTDTIKLKTHINYEKGISISKNLTLNLQNYDLIVTNNTGIGLEVKEAILSVEGSGRLKVTGENGVRAYKGIVTVESATGTNGYGVLAQEGGKVTVKTTAQGSKEGIYATGKYSQITAREAVATALNGKAVLAEFGGIVDVLGNATANEGYSVYCLSGERAVVGGNVTGKDPAVYLYEKGNIEISGNLNTNGGNGTVVEIGGSSNPTGTVKISVSVFASADKYILFSSNYQDKNSGDLDPAVGGYLKYTDKSGADQDGVVWVMGIDSMESIDVGNDSQFDTALVLVAHGGTIRLTANINYDKGIFIRNKTVNFDLNGYTLNVNNSDGAGLKVVSGIVIAKGSGAMNVTGTTYGLWALQDSPRMTMVNITNATATEGPGIGAFDSNTDVVVSGNAQGGSFGVYSPSGSSVRVGGDVRGIDCGVSILASWQAHTEVIVRGNVVVTGPNGIGLKTCGDGKIIVDGSIIAKRQGVYNSHGGEIIVRGNIDVSGPDSIGAEMIGLGIVTINGIMTAETYIKIYEKIFTADNYTIDDKKPNYLKYADRDDQVVWILKRSAPQTYALTVQNGTGSGSYEKDAYVTITANDAPEGQKFKEWVITPAVTFEGDTTKNSQTVGFKMLAEEIIAIATYEELLIPETFYNVTVNSSYAEISGAGSYVEGNAVNINAGSRIGYTFNGWTSSEGVIFSNKNIASTSFIMPTQNVTITANWTYNNGNSGNGNNSNNDLDESSVEDNLYTSTITILPSSLEQPDLPTTAEIKINVKVDENGKMLVSVADQFIIDGIKAAQDASHKNGTKNNGIAIMLNLFTDRIASNLSITLTQNAINELIKAEVKELRFFTSTLTIAFDLKALKKAIQTGGNMMVMAKKVDVNSLSETARTAIGNRPAFDLEIQCDGKAVSDFASGLVYVTLPYILDINEEVDRLLGLHVDGNGQITWLLSSNYDKSIKGLRFTTDHFSIFGIAYKVDALTFTDSTMSETKKNITYVVKKGDTLWDIAKLHNCTVEEIIALNSNLIKNPNLIFVGWSLKILQ